MFISHSFRHYFGVEIGHLQMAIYTSRREEMINVVRATLFYMNPNEPVPVHSLSALSSPYQVILIYFAVLLVWYVFRLWLSVFIWIVDVLMINTILPCFCGVASIVFILFGLPTHFVCLFIADNLWRYANDVFLWPASRDGPGIRCQDRMVLSSQSAHPCTWSLHSCSAALPSSRVARSIQPVLLLTSITTHKQF